MEMNTVTIALGSNQGNREHFIKEAIQGITTKVGQLELCSPFYENKAQGFESQNLFLNGCIVVQTTMEPKDILIELKEIESHLGRLKNDSHGYASRPIDLDIILFENKILQHSDLYIPHPRFRERIFVLRPLCDIQPNAIDPVSCKSVMELTLECSDKSELTIYELK
jgi:2-amino-4-hydroxy-6-hydroxymethyldihydropteridine diphosphokinase